MPRARGLMSSFALAARRLYDLEQTSPERLRAIARAMMDRRRAEGRDAEVVRAGELAALLALQDVAEAAIRALTEDRPEALDSLLAALDGELGSAGVDELLSEIVEEFLPPIAARRRAATRRALDRRTAVGSLAVLWELNRNPALANLRELFDDRSLAPALYEPAARVLAAASGPAGEAAATNDLLAKLDEPRRASPDSIAGQLAYVLERWPESAGARRERLLRVLDALEEETPRPPPGPGPIELPPEEALRPPRVPEELRPEVHWMHELVLVAKHAHVWLDQLSREHGRLIQRLDEVPDEELARLADLGMTGLWTIGVWERSAASREIKRICGQPDGEASAYSVFDYSVAADLGGEEALEALQERALAHGISLGVDVVPNHFGLDSRWLRDHPERFLSVASCPYPSYTFDGPDLSSDPDVGIYLEDHYYDRTDAAVVFKRVDRLTGEERFVYHGNDGTSTPWNDTAQLDYTRPDVRRAMADIIVGLARRFRVLRFDAAMTLTRLHYQRLWFPAPGAGGAVPSRS